MSGIYFDENLDTVLALAKEAYYNALNKHPEKVTPATRLNTITEEYLEVVTAFNDGQEKETLKEMYDLAGVLIRAIKEREDCKGTWCA